MIFHFYDYLHQLIMGQDSEQFKVLENGEIVNIPSPTSSKSDFDFFVGNWEIRNKRLKTRLNNCDEWIEYIQDRPFNDQRYYISNQKLKNLGWEIKIELMDGIKELV